MPSIEKGYILLARKIDESEIKTKPPHFRETWLYLLRNASHKDRRIYGLEIKRGQLFTSYSMIIDSLKWKVGKRTEKYTQSNMICVFRYFKKAKMISTQKTTHGMIVTIINYNHYQNANNYEKTKKEIDKKQNGKIKTDQEINEIKTIFRNTAAKLGIRNLKSNLSNQFINYHKSNKFLFRGRPIEFEDWEGLSEYYLQNPKNK